jgi:hypothetical protein
MAANEIVIVPVAHYWNLELFCIFKAGAASFFLPHQGY